MPRAKRAAAAIAIAAGLAFASAAPALAETPTAPAPTTSQPPTTQQFPRQQDGFGPMGRHRMDWDDRGDGNERGRGVPGSGFARSDHWGGGWGLLLVAGAGIAALVVFAIGGLIGFLVGRSRKRHSPPGGPPQYAAPQPPAQAAPVAAATAPVYTPPAPEASGTADTAASGGSEPPAES